MKKDLFPDNWIYIHDPDVRVARIQNFKNWSAAMVPDLNTTCLGLEYFCFQGDGLWSMSDQALIELGKKELEYLGLASRIDVQDGAVVRMPKAYPVYDAYYRKALGTIREFLDQFSNLQLVGRNGMHRYNNQDHSMLTAMLAVENICGADHDLWAVNANPDYHEELISGEDQLFNTRSALDTTQPLVPFPREELSLQEKSLIRTFSRIDNLAFAVALGSVSGLAIFIATLWALWSEDPFAPSSIQLLDQYFLGYTVTMTGAFIALGYAFVWGFLWGWLFAYLRNFFIALFIYRVKKQMEMLSFKDFLDHY